MQPKAKPHETENKVFEPTKIKSFQEQVLKVSTICSCSGFKNKTAAADDDDDDDDGRCGDRLRRVAIASAAPDD